MTIHQYNNYFESKTQTNLISAVATNNRVTLKICLNVFYNLLDHPLGPIVQPNKLTHNHFCLCPSFCISYHLCVTFSLCFFSTFVTFSFSYTWSSRKAGKYPMHTGKA